MCYYFVLCEVPDSVLQSRRKFLGRVTTAATAAVVSNQLTPAGQPTQDPNPQDSTTGEVKRQQLREALQPTPFTNDELKTIQSWANSENGILRSIASYNDSFTQDFNQRNPAGEPLTFEGVNHAFGKQFEIPLDRLIRVNSPLQGVDQANPHYAYLSNSVKWNSKEHNKQLFRILLRDQKSIDKDRQAIEDNDFSGQNGNPLSPRDKRLALRALELTRPHWDLRSPYQSAKLETTKDGSLRSLEFDVAKVGEPNLRQPRTIYFQDSKAQETPSKIPEGSIYLSPEQYKEIKPNP